jgi:F-type H+-transporting ATPase subunit epsilon
MNLVTPRGVVALQETDSVQAPGEEGAFELLPGHVPMLAALKAGVLTVGKKTRFAVSNGYLRVDPQNAVEILVEQAVAVKDIDVESARKDLASAESDLAKWGDRELDGDYQNLMHKQAWAKARIDAAAAGAN